MSSTIAKDTPLQEITLRRYEKPSNLHGRNLIRKLCLSVGLLQVGDSRDVVVDVLYVLLKAKKELSSDDVVKLVIEYRKQENLQLRGIAASNIRRQIKRLRNLYFIEKITNNYRITELAGLSDTFEEKIEKFILPSMVSRVKEYLHAADAEFMDMKAGQEIQRT